MRFTILAACGLLAACGGGSGDVLAGSAQSDIPALLNGGSDFVPASDTGFGNVSFGLRLNGIRIDAGVLPVIENDTLNQVAQNYAQVQVDGGFLSHVDQNGQTVGNRALAGGYDYRYISENLARGYFDEASVMDAWMASDSHRDNIIDPRPEEFGVGREDSTWVLLLGSEFD